MSMMKRLIEESSEPYADWVVIPSLSQVSERHHIPNGSYRLMECIGRDRWLERKVGGKRELEPIAMQNNKENYHTPLTNDEIIDKERFSVMERLRNPDVFNLKGGSRAG